jgi:hypothetical protein
MRHFLVLTVLVLALPALAGTLLIAPSALAAEGGQRRSEVNVTDCACSAIDTHQLHGSPTNDEPE